MAERIKNLGFRDEVIGGRRSSGFSPPPSGGSGIQGFLAGFEAVERNEKAEKIRAERAKEKALKSYLDTVSVDYKTQIDVMESESPRNAQAIVKKGTAYRDGIVDSAPPVLQPLIRARIDNYLNLKRSKANKAATLEIQAQNEATEARLASRDFAILSEASAGIYSNDMDLRNASEVEVQSLERELATRLFSQGIDDFGVPFDLHKKEDITARLQNFQDISQSAAIKAWFREQEDPDKAYLQLKRGGFKVDITTFKRNRKDGSVEETFKSVNVVNAISGDGRKKLFEDIASEISSINSIADKEEKQETEDTKKAQRLTGFDNWRKIDEPNPDEAPLTLDTIRQQLEANLIEKDDAIAQQKAITDPERIEDDPDFYNTVDQQIDLGVDFLAEINEGFAAGLLSKKSAALLRTENRAVLDKTRTSLEKAVDDAASDTLKDLNTGLKVNTLFTILDRDQGPRQVKARQEARRRINEIKSEAEIKTIEDVELFREKLNRLNAELIRTHRFKKKEAAPIPAEVPALTPDQLTMKTLKEGVENLRKQKNLGAITEDAFNTGSLQIMQLIENLKSKQAETE